MKPTDPITVEPPALPDSAADALTEGRDLEAGEELIERQLSRSRLAGAHRALRVRDIECSNCDARNASVLDARASRVAVRDSNIMGLDISGGELRDVLVTGTQCRLLRAFGTKFECCVFESCDLREADFDDAAFERVAFRDCDLRGARLLSRSLAGVDLRGSRVDGIVVAPNSLAGLIIEPTQADVFAAAMGMAVRPLSADESEQHWRET